MAGNDEFRVNMKHWIQSGLIEPAVNGLRYTDIEDSIHRASVLPNGFIQANAPGGKVYQSLKSWMTTFMDLSPGQNKLWQAELKRVQYRREKDDAWMSMWRLYRMSKSFYDFD